MSLLSGSCKSASLISGFQHSTTRATSSLALFNPGLACLPRGIQGACSFGTVDSYSRPSCIIIKVSDICRGSRFNRRQQHPGHRKSIYSSVDQKRFFPDSGSKRSLSADEGEPLPSHQFPVAAELLEPQSIEDISASTDQARETRRLKQHEAVNERRSQLKERMAQDLDRVGEEVKGIMRRVPHPVAIITSTDISFSPEGAPSAWRGATVSSFNTVTLWPRPIVSFNIKMLSSTYEAIKSSGFFNVHLFDSNKRAAQIAHRFSSGNASAPFHHVDGRLKRDIVVPTYGRGSLHPSKQYEIGRESPQILHARVLHCKCLAHQTVKIEDHVVLFGEVSSVSAPPRWNRNTKSQLFLSYADGKYQIPASHTEGIIREEEVTVGTAVTNPETAEPTAATTVVDSTKKEEATEKSIVQETNPYKKFL